MKDETFASFELPSPPSYIQQQHFQPQGALDFYFLFSSAPPFIETQRNPTKVKSEKFLKIPFLHFPTLSSCQHVPTSCKQHKAAKFGPSIENQDSPRKLTSQAFLKIPLLPFFSKSNKPSTLNLSSTTFSTETRQNPTNPTKSTSHQFQKMAALLFPSSQNAPIYSNFLSTSLSVEAELQSRPKLTSQKVLRDSSPTAKTSLRMQSKSLMRSLSVLERSLIGAMAGGIAGAFTYVCLHPLDTVKTKLQTKGASRIYNSALDAIIKTFQTQGILGFYSGVSAVIVGSTFSSSVYFGTCEFGKSILAKLPNYPSILIPPTAGAMGNVASSAIMVPKELITQRMQTGTPGRSWQVLLRILEKDGILGLYAGYSATLLRNLPAGVLSYSSFEYLKSAVLHKTGKSHLEPIQSVCCGALAGAISASLTTPLDVVKTRLMTQGDVAKSKIVESVYGGISSTVRQILKEEGWVGLTRGMGPRVLHSACFAALGYFAFETARLTLLHRYALHQKDKMEKVGTCS